MVKFIQLICASSVWISPQSVRVCSPQLSVDILLELSHVEHSERFLDIDEALGKLHHVVADGALLGAVLDEDLAAAEPLQQDVAALVHLHLGSLPYHLFKLLGFGIPHRIRESVEPQSR